MIKIKNGCPSCHKEVWLDEDEGYLWELKEAVNYKLGIEKITPRENVFILHKCKKEISK